MKELSLYDILGVLAPGAVVTVGIIALFPDTAAVLANKSFSVGEFGIVILVSYIIGNLVAGLGNFLEAAYWKLRGGWPTDRAIRGDGIIQAREREALQDRLRANTLIKSGEILAELASSDWRGLSRRIYLDLGNPSAKHRVDVFNAQYGMNRGIAAGFLALAVLVIIHAGLSPWRIELVLAACIVLACYRMERFGRYYASELLRGYLSPVKETTKAPAAPQS